MRALSPVLAAAAFTALAACGDDEEAPGRRAGEACAAAAECARGLVCFQRTCAASYAASPSCAPPGTPRIVRGDPVQIPEVPETTCVTTVRDPIPASPLVSPGDPLPSGAFVDLGEHVVGTDLTVDVPPGISGLTIVSQDVLGDAALREIEFQGFIIPNTVVPTNVRFPGGLFFSDTARPPRDEEGYDDVTGVLAYYAGFNGLSGSFSVPNTAAALDLVRTEGQLPPGRWAFTVNDWARECFGIPEPIQGCSGGNASGRYRVHAYAHPGPLASTGTLDLEVYLATDPNGPMPRADVAVPTDGPPHPQISRFVEKLGEQFARAGICLGTVTFRDLPQWARDRFAPSGVVDISGAGLGNEDPNLTPFGCDDLSQLFTVGVAPSRAVHLFLSDELRDGAAGGPGLVLGIDGSIPGPSGFPGTVNGGAIVGAFDALGAELFPGACSGAQAPAWSCGTDVLAYVAAHEAGHWLGLYHTTEAVGTTFDPLSDTGRCPCLACAPERERAFCAERGSPAPTLMEGSFCGGVSTPAADIAARAVPGLACSGAQNLMFWQFDPDLARGEFSAQQAEVMRLNPAVRR